MVSFKLIIKLLSQILFLTIVFTSLNAKSLDKYNKASNISNYFSGILSISEDEHNKSYNFLKRLNGLEDYHKNYASVYLSALVKNKQFKEAYRYAKKIEAKNIEYFNSDLIIGTYYIKNNNLKKAKIYFDKINNIEEQSVFNRIIAQTLNFWMNADTNELTKNNNFNVFGAEFENIKKIQNVFFNCFADNEETEKSFIELISNNKVNFSRYNYFYANYLVSKNKVSKSLEFLNDALSENPRNLMLNQMKINLQKERKIFANQFDCKKLSHNIAEFYYLLANLLSSQSLYSMSNFYLSLAKYLNPNLISYDTLYAENLSFNDKLKEANKIYNQIKIYGEIYNWHATKKIISLDLENKIEDEKKIKILENSFNNITEPNVFHKYDYANLLRRYKNYNQSISQYSSILKTINFEHELYAKVTDGRGIAYERIGNWEDAEKDFLNSLSQNPNQPYVINYLAYSWVDKGMNISKSLEMLRKANELKKK